MQLTLGADPEVFVRKNGVLCSAYGLIPGTKEKPHPVTKGAVQVDGMALEFNIDPASTQAEFTGNVIEVMSRLRQMTEGYILSQDSVAEFGTEFIANQPPAATEIGCDPDFNAWTGVPNDQPDQALSFRTAAGHVHVGWTKDVEVEDGHHIGICREMVRQFDFFLGLPSLIFDPEVKRREMYGRAGAFRPKSYGMEYRVLSNKWVSSPILMNWVWSASTKAVEEFNKGNLLELKYGDIQDIINNTDLASAREIIKDEGLEIPHGYV